MFVKPGRVKGEPLSGILRGEMRSEESVVVVVVVVRCKQPKRGFGKAATTRHLPSK
jgi:hypothetical protein